MPDASNRHFGDCLIQRIRDLGHPLCVGLDPHLDKIPAPFRRGSMEPRHPATAEAVRQFLTEVVDRLEGRVAAIKPQIAFFEELGWRGLEVLDALVTRARERDLLVVLDAKRGDIGSTADGYARAYLEPTSALPVDAITLNPYLGPETLDPFVRRCREFGRGMFVLVKTSNPGSSAYQDRVLADADTGTPLFEVVARSLADHASELAGTATQWSSLGVVVGATYPGQAERVRVLLPSALLLVPGYGAQGASASEALRGFVAGPKGLEGGIVNSSRAILFPDAGGDPDLAAWENAFEAALARAIDELGTAVRS